MVCSSMPAAPHISPVPPPVFMPQIPTPSRATPSPIPHRPGSSNDVMKPKPESVESHLRSPTFPLPKLRLEIRDLEHSGSRAFLSSVVPTTAIEFAVRRSFDLLYISPKFPTTTIPGTRSITLILRSMGGVAYTTGLELDSDHKEIHFSLEYIKNISKSRLADEILGVLTHEVVHCYQYNARGTCPGGLVEGIADWVRLNSSLSPPHWKREASGKWDAGYQHTAYFLDYLEKRYGEGTISRMNEKLRINEYDENRFWTELLGRPVDQLWGDYAETVENEKAVLPTSTAQARVAEGDEEEIVVVDKEDAQSRENC